MKARWALWILFAVYMLAPALTTGPAHARCMFFCPQRHYRHPAPEHSHSFCKGVQDAIAKRPLTNDDDFVASFPTGEQSKVRKCLVVTP